MTSGNGNAAPLPYATPNFTPELPFKDQRGGLKTMGIVMIVLGCFSGCMSAAMPLTLLIPRMPGQPTPALRDFVAGIATYGLLALVLITIGAGSMRLRRWSRPIVMIVMGSAAVFGATSLVIFLFMGPALTRAMASAATVAATTAPTTGPTTAPVVVALTPTTGQLITGMVVGGCFMLVFMVALPAGFFWFFKRESVQQTLDYFAPTPTWTDRCPTPVLAVSFWLVAGAVLTLTYCAWAIYPAFGVLLRGTPAIAALVTTAVVQLLLAWAVYRMSPAAWWATALLVVVASVNMVVTYVRIDPLDIYRATASSPEQLEMMQRMGVASRPAMIAPAVVYGLAVLGYLLWARRFFSRPINPS